MIRENVVDLITLIKYVEPHERESGLANQKAREPISKGVLVATEQIPERGG